NHREIERKWQAYWLKHNSYATKTPSAKSKKRYLLAMFPYPSGEGLHVGHVEVYTGTDVLARYHRMNGDAVLHPMGWDSFGLPAENYAIKKGVHPKETTERNIKRYKEQLNSLGYSYDWSLEITTSSTEYYRWTQWLFLQLYSAGLAYQAEAAVNWCPSCQTVLANEQVIDGACERCGTAVEQKQMRQWFFKITKYAEELLTKLDDLKWPESIKNSQRNWIGKSDGLLFSAPVKDSDLVIETFSAHYAACYADTFVVIAPDHPLLAVLVAEQPNKKEIEQFCSDVIKERAATREAPEIKGIFTGRYIKNPLDGQDLPIWVANFAIASYGTGIVKCSAHDERDFAFAKKYDIPLKVCLVPADESEATKVRQLEYCYTDMQNGILTEPAEVDGQRAGDCKQLIIDHCVKHGFAEPMTNYKLRDWLISRQRYWGAPIPIIHCDTCGAVPVPEDQLPVLLPDDVDFQPHGHSPLADSKSFGAVNCPNCGESAKRETDTMDTFVCSSWYYLRYPSADSKTEPFKPADLKTWLPVDRYIGGAEHAVLHLLYARFITKFLRDQGLVHFDEPFLELHNAGVILGADHQKMSKSKGNVANPDDIIAEYGADVLRLHELFLGPYSDEKPWSVETIKGSRRFLEAIVRWAERLQQDQVAASSAKARTIIAQTVAKVTADTNSLHFNTAIAQLMTALNELKKEAVSQTDFDTLLLLLAPYAPHLTSEIWSWQHQDDVHQQSWPVADVKLLQNNTCIVAVQINGKLRGTIEAAVDATEAQLRAQAEAESKVALHLAGKQIQRVVIVPQKIVNFIVTD
ncbi:MAG: leucine--tRNA ligase, partial [bacterium]|nr:leucine--tRNA ligase [bacterium]